MSLMILNKTLSYNTENFVAVMLNKFLNVHKLGSFSSHGRPKPVARVQVKPKESQGTSSALKIVHPGGVVECYYMAITAANVMKKYPSFVLARPEVFRRPWDSLVRSHEILTPGQKFYVVPRCTVRKLRRRIKKPNGEVPMSSFVSQSSIDVSKDGLSSKSFLKRNDVSDSSGSFTRKTRNRNGIKKHVRFEGIDVKQKYDLATDDKTGKDDGIDIADNSKKILKSILWRPRLAAISERHGHVE